MTDRDPFADLLAPLADARPLPASSRTALLAALLADAEQHWGDRLAVAAAPRPLPGPLRSALLLRLSRSRRWRSEGIVAAAALLVTALALSVALTGDRSPRPLARQAPSGPTPVLTAAPVPPRTVGPAPLGLPATPSTSAPTSTLPAVTPRPPDPTPGAGAPAAGGPAATGAGAAAGGPSQAAVTAVTPREGPLAGGTRVTVTGRGLSRIVRLEIAGEEASELTVTSDTSVSAVTPPAARAGGAQVVAVLADGGRYGLSPGFTYLERPGLDALDPQEGPAAGGNWVTLAGSHFTPRSTVRFGSTAAEQVRWLAATSLQALVPAHLPGPVDVVVETAGGVSQGVRYLYLA